jgi:hypothetical protein
MKHGQPKAGNDGTRGGVGPAVEVTELAHR